jgi:hypothetical protein
MKQSDIGKGPIQPNPRNPILKALKHPNSRAAAIAAKCADCVGCNLNHLESGFRRSIAECELNHCPLHQFCPFTDKRGLKDNRGSFAIPSCRPDIEE